MKKLLKIIGVIVLVILVLLIALIVNVMIDNRTQAKDQELMIKSDEDLIGTHLYIERDGLNSVDLNLYLADSDSSVPLVLNLHGGAFIAGDADTLDTQSDRISSDWNVNVATINYSLLTDGIDMEY